MSALLSPCLLIALAVGGCSRTGMLAKVAAASDAGASTEADGAPADVTFADAGADTRTNADVGVDARVDAARDVGTDLRPIADAPVDGHADMRPDAKPDVGRDAGADAGPDARADAIPTCNCNQHERCNVLTGTCACIDGYAGDDCALCDWRGGYVEWPMGSDTCIQDPCAGITCGGVGTCLIDDNGVAKCNCPAGWSGLKCDQQWQTIWMPPFVVDLALDSKGNGWFLTTQGLLYWDFGGTPEDTSDDNWYLRDTPGFAKTILVDSADRKWVASGQQLLVLDDKQTPGDSSDDVWETLPASADTYEEIKRFRLDKKNRIWLMIEGESGIEVLSDMSLPKQGTPTWTTLFDNERVSDVAVENSGVWLAAESGLHYVDLGSSLSDASDDKWTDFAAEAALQGRRVVTIAIDGKGAKWLNTDAGVLRLEDGGDPFDHTKHVWTRWAPRIDGKATDTGPVMVMAADGAKWLKSTWGSALRISETAAGDDKLIQYNPKSYFYFALRNSTSWIHAVALDTLGHKWLSADGHLYYFDDRGSPTDLSDDKWFYAGRPRFDHEVSKIVADRHGGFWVMTVGPVHGPLSCNNGIYYFHPGDMSNGFDDVWADHSDGNSMGSCISPFGLDAAERPWLKFGSPNGGYGPHAVLEDGGTPLDRSDDTWVYWSDETPLSPWATLTGFDPAGGIWFGGMHLDYGKSVADKTDDRWLTIDAFSPTTLAVDSSGGRWFGYQDLTSDGIGGLVRYFDDRGTLADLSDDTWVDFGTADGLRLDDIAEIQVDGRGIKWINGWQDGSGPRLCSLDDNGTPTDKSDDEWVLYSVADGVVGRDVESFAIDRSSDLWIATMSGLRYLHLKR